MTKKIPSPSTSASPMSWAPAVPAPSIASGNSASSAAPSSAPVGEKARGIGVRAPAAAEYRGDSERAEAPSGERAEIALPAPARVEVESLGRPGVVPQEGRAHLLAHLEVSRADRRAQPCEEL